MSRDTDSLGDRMKNYERVPQNDLMCRTPVIIRLDGVAFHTYTRGFDKPFSDLLSECMGYTAECLMKAIQGAKLAYTQSDEISLLLTDYEKLETQAWFGYNVQKLVSVTASIATEAFNRHMSEILKEFNKEVTGRKIALFDSRCFNLSKEEVTNYFYWRQQDAMRNSVAAVAHANFSQKQLQGKNRTAMKEMLLEKGIDYDKDIPLKYQRGFCLLEDWNGLLTYDENIPIWKGEGRNYIEKILEASECSND